MIIIKEKKQPLTEMANLAKNEAPKALLDRTARLVIDRWFCDRHEEPNNREKVAFRYSQFISSNPKIVLDFDYGFIHRQYQYSKNGAKTSGSPNKRKWTFCALHLISGGLIPRPLGRFKPGGAGDLFPRIRKYFKEKSSIPRRSAAGIFIQQYPQCNRAMG